MRLVATIVVALPFLLPYLLISDSLPLGVLFLFKTSLPFSCFGFVLFSVNNVVLERLKLTNEEKSFRLDASKTTKENSTVETGGDATSMTIRRIDRSRLV